MMQRFCIYKDQGEKARVDSGLAFENDKNIHHYPIIFKTVRNNLSRSRRLIRTFMSDNFQTIIQEREGHLN